MLIECYQKGASYVNPNHVVSAHITEDGEEENTMLFNLVIQLSDGTTKTVNGEYKELKEYVKKLDRFFHENA